MVIELKFGIIKEKNQFRVWSKKEKKMYYGIYNLEPFIDNDNYVIMQCCGFRDMNKTLAYEGDVVMPYDDFYCILEYGFGEFTLSPISYEKCQEIRKKDLIWNPAQWMVWKREIIGNIFENHFDGIEI